MMVAQGKPYRHVDHFYACDAASGGMVFEGTLAQYDDCFGIAINANEKQCLDHATAQGWHFFQKMEQVA